MAAHATTPTTANTPPGHTPPRPQLDCIAEDCAALNTTIPDDFWHEMRDQQLVADAAPVIHLMKTEHLNMDNIRYP